MANRRKTEFLTVLAALFCVTAVRADNPPVTTQIQKVLDDYVAERHEIEVSRASPSTFRSATRDPLSRRSRAITGVRTSARSTATRCGRSGVTPNTLKPRSSCGSRPTNGSLPGRRSGTGCLNITPGAM